MKHREQEMRHICPDISDWWPLEMGVCSTSASKAAKIAKYHLGFDEVILCGSPLDDSGYFPGEGKGIPQNRSCLRVGDPGLSSHTTPHHTGQYTTQPGMPMRVQESKIIQSYRTRFRQLAEGEFKNWVYSMSGFTREILGYPPQRKLQMAMLPAGFTPNIVLDGSPKNYEKSESYGGTEGRGGPPKHNPEGYKQDASGTTDGGAYSPLWRDAAKSEGTKKGGTDHNTSKAPSDVGLAISEPAAYSRDWSGK